MCVAIKTRLWRMHIQLSTQYVNINKSIDLFQSRRKAVSHRLWEVRLRPRLSKRPRGHPVTAARNSSNATTASASTRHCLVTATTTVAITRTRSRAQVGWTAYNSLAFPRCSVCRGTAIWVCPREYFNPDVIKGAGVVTSVEVEINPVNSSQLQVGV